MVFLIVGSAIAIDKDKDKNKEEIKKVKDLERKTPNNPDKIKLKTYIDSNYKSKIGHTNVMIRDYVQYQNITMIWIETDGQTIKWLTTDSNFNTIRK